MVNVVLCLSCLAHPHHGPLPSRFQALDADAKPVGNSGRAVDNKILASNTIRRNGNHYHPLLYIYSTCLLLQMARALPFLSAAIPGLSLSS